MASTVSQLYQLVSQEIEQYCSRTGDSEMVKPIHYLIRIGGKRIRPIAALMAAEMFGAKATDVIQPCLALEVFHNFTLMHDDIMDESDLRRNQPTVHKKWNVNTAILSGDAMMIHSYQLLAKAPGAQLPQLLELFNTTALEVCEGQMQDMSFETRDDVSVSEYIEMIRLKTSVLLAGSVQLGAMLGGASPDDQKCIYEFGEKLGISFQLWDDYLDTFGEQDKVGKVIGGDLVNDKKTFLSISLSALANAEERALILSLKGKNSVPRDQKVDQLKQLLAKYGLDESIQRESRRFYDEAILALRKINVPEADKQGFYDLAASLLERQS